MRYLLHIYTRVFVLWAIQDFFNVIPKYSWNLITMTRIAYYCREQLQIISNARWRPQSLLFWIVRTTATNFDKGSQDCHREHLSSVGVVVKGYEPVLPVVQRAMRHVSSEHLAQPAGARARHGRARRWQQRVAVAEESRGVLQLNNNYFN